jgi:hypothetical protein
VIACFRVIARRGYFCWGFWCVVVVGCHRIVFCFLVFGRCVVFFGGLIIFLEFI